MRQWLWTMAAVSALAASSALAQATPVEIAPVVVVGATPIGGGIDPDKLAAPIQTANAQDIEDSHALDLSAFMSRRLGSVYINDVQNNPLQSDLNYRGYTASPLLGTPQGLSLYVDGVRFNQPFGDVVSWDLIPKKAIASVALMPGSNPLFGLNTLGGALSIRTKDGLSAPGVTVEGGYGSYDRRTLEAEAGGELDRGLNWYVTGLGFKDDGWRDASESNATQLFGKLGWIGERTKIALSGAFARSDLSGNGLQEQRFLQRDRGGAYTKPDITQNESGLANLTFDHRFGDALSVSGNAYWRRITTRTYNGDINEEALTETIYQPSAAERAALTAAGITGFPLAGESAANTPFPFYRCLANVLLNAEPSEKCNGLINRTGTTQHEAGAQAQATWRGASHQLTVGAAYAESRSHFLQSSQYGYLTPDRGIIGATGRGAFADGSQASENAQDSRVDLIGRTRTASLYATDTLDFGDGFALTVSGRYDANRVKNSDAITPGGGSGSLDGTHHFNRLNPAVGLTWTATPQITAYAGITQGSRAPSAIELGCADPDNPCRLPNALAGDPPLKQVKTTTGELGARGRVAGFNWNAGVFRAENRDDILFVSDDTAGFGFFKNFGKTRRQGIELGVNGRLGTLDLGANYTLLDATYRSEESVGGAGNSENDTGPGFEGAIDIERGDRIPLVPKHIFKANARWAVTEQISVDADVIALSGVYARGNENNAHEPDGVFYLGKGKTDGYAVFNLGADYEPMPGLKLFVQVNNVFDANYETAAQLGATGFTDTGAFIARPFASPVIDGERPTRNATFYAPGAPRMVWAGVRYRFGGR